MLEEEEEDRRKVGESDAYWIGGGGTQGGLSPILYI